MSASEDTTRFPPRRLGAILKSRPFLTVLVVAAVWIVAGILKPGFGSFGHLRYLIELAAVIGLVAVGQTFVVIAGGIDLSVAAIVTVSAVGVPLVAWGFDGTGAISVLVILAIATGIGLLNGLGVALLRVHPMIMTLAMATFLQGVLILIAGGSAVSMQNPLLPGSATPVRSGRRRASTSGSSFPSLRCSSCTRRRSARASSRSAPTPRLGALRRRRRRHHDHGGLCGERADGRARRRPRPRHERPGLCRDR